MKKLMRVKGSAVISALTLILLQFAVLAFPVPTHAISTTTVPTSGAVGESISISGEGFAGRVATIYWDSQIVLTGIPISETGQLTCNLQVPPACKGSHTIKITDDSNWTSSTASATFTVLPQITIFPRIGRLYTPVTVIGNGFAAFERDIKVTWDGNILPASATANHLGTWGINFNVAETTKGDHLIGAFSSATNASEIKQVKFLVAPFAKVEPTSGPVGTEIRLDGFGFRTGEDGITITYDDNIILFNIEGGADGSWTTTLNIPPSTQGNHIIGVFGSSFTPRGIVPDTDFNVIPHIEPQPASGNKGTQVTVKGTGFAKNETVTITFNEVEINVAATADNTGSFSAKFEVPQNNVKENTITATGSNRNSAQAIFIIEKITPPAPKLLSPKQGARLEVFGSVNDVFLRATKRLIAVIAYTGQQALGAPPTTFDWSDISDTSNPSYVLQIARDADFSSPALVREHLADSEYTLSEKDNLTQRIYSWRVKAVDDLGNETPWSDVQKFEVILMSTQVLILSLAIPALFLAAIAAAVVLTWRTQRLKTY